MKRPKLAVRSIDRMARSDAGSVDLTVTDSNGNTMEVSLSPMAAGQLLESLVSSPSLREDPGNLGRHFRIQGLGRHRLQDGSYGFELFLRQGQAIRVSMDPRVAQAMQGMIETFGDESTWTSAPPPH